jgi:NAD(P)-dependent dehydrogenase (short-subunit alcohol dehydrogenase family)
MAQSIEKAVVIGGTSGIGEATARLFSKSDVQVTIAGRNPNKLAAALERLGNVQGKIVDGMSSESVKQLFEALGSFDHLVLALSGGRGAGPFAAIPLDDIRSGFEAKLFAQLNTLKAALPYVKSSVTFISAATAAAAISGTAGLAAINGAVEAVIRPLAIELAPLRVNAVRPGIIDTPWWDNSPKDFKSAVFAQTSQTLPVKRVGQPEDVAKAIVMVATNGFITGSVIDVSGGGTLAR